MTIKRTELEILDFAITISGIKAKAECKRDEVINEYNSNNNVCFKKEDYKREYEYKLKMQTLDARIDRFNEEINGLNAQLNLLRWLYKEEVK